MKKLLSIALAVVMMFAICVPAFATDITKDTAQSASADVVTKDTKEDGTDAYYYTITFPASTEIAWGDTAEKGISYSVTSQLLLGASLDVSVAADNSGLMTNANTTKTLTYTLSGGAVENFAEVNDAEAPATAVTVAVEDFSGVPVAAYAGTVTYTVVYNAPATV